jgi:uncharacterized phage protein gp47/JayE
MAYNFITPSGVVVPDTGELLATVQQEYRDALGQDLSLDPETPQGVMISAETIARDSVVRNNANLANQINPNYAGGIFLDAIAAMTGLSRRGASRSLVVATLSGAPSTIVPVGAKARTAIGDEFELISAAIIGIGGTVDATFRSVEFGPIPAAAGTLTQIVDGALGWEGITNTNDAALGQSIQSDYAFRTLRKRTLALQSTSLVESIISKLYMVEGVRSLKFRENYTDAPVDIDDVTLAPHSVYACVDGGSDIDVATALLSKKSMGADWNGDVEVDVLDEFSGQLYPVKFDRPTAVPIEIRVTVKSGSPLIDAYEETVRAIMDYASGLQEGEDGFVVGEDVSTWEIGGAINRRQSALYVLNLEISDDAGATWQTTPIDIEINQIPTISEEDIEVTVV